MLFQARRHAFIYSHILSVQRYGLQILAIVFLLGVPASLLAQGNGISVGQPKVYDNQSLMIMLEQLGARLNQVQVIDQQSLTKALGLVQGSQEQDVTRSFDASVSVTPKVMTDAISNTSKTASSTDNSSKSNSSQNTPQANSSNTSALPELLAAPSYKPDYGENSLDLLSDQVDLTYQIFNLRMLLERL